MTYVQFGHMALKNYRNSDHTLTTSTPQLNLTTHTHTNQSTSLTQLFTLTPTTNSNQTYTSNQLTELYSYTKTAFTPKHAKILLSTAKHYDIDASSLIIRDYNKDWTTY